MKTTLIALIAMVLLVGCGCARKNRSVVSLASISPDGVYRAELVEWNLHDIDRNFWLRLTRISNNVATNIFSSPDEGRPIGTERIVWSLDSSKFILLGKHFMVEDRARLPNGEAIYLLFDIKSGRVRCNATQQNQYTNFSLEDLKSIKWSKDI